MSWRCCQHILTGIINIICCSKCAPSGALHVSGKWTGNTGRILANRIAVAGEGRTCVYTRGYSMQYCCTSRLWRCILCCSKCNVAWYFVGLPAHIATHPDSVRQCRLKHHSNVRWQHIVIGPCVLQISPKQLTVYFVAYPVSMVLISCSDFVRARVIGSYISSQIARPPCARGPARGVESLFPPTKT